MNLRQKTQRVVFSGILVMAGAIAAGQTGAETFTATATVKTAGRGSAESQLTITVDRKMTQSEADGLIAAFKTGGAAGLRKALVGVPPTGSIRLGNGAPTTSRLTLERATGPGRLLTIVTDKPVLFLGAGLPEAKAKEGFDFAIVDIVVDAKGSGTGTLAPAAKVTLNQGAFVVQDYGSEVVQLTAVRKVK